MSDASTETTTTPRSHPDSPDSALWPTSDAEARRRFARQGGWRDRVFAVRRVGVLWALAAVFLVVFGGGGIAIMFAAGSRVTAGSIVGGLILSAIGVLFFWFYAYGARYAAAHRDTTVHNADASRDATFDWARRKPASYLTTITLVIGLGTGFRVGANSPTDDAVVAGVAAGLVGLIIGLCVIHAARRRAPRT